MFRVKAVADMLDVSVNTIYRAVETGELNALKIGKALRIPGAALNAYLSQCAEPVDAQVLSDQVASVADAGTAQDAAITSEVSR
nr:helix-turn-helix domain-containing protein [Actinokineospora iranica]